jgi:murein L,D-transpeptidase YafK
MKKIVLLFVALMLVVTSQAFAKPKYYKDFTTKYPNAAALAKAKCVICHEGGSKLNPYGQDLQKAAHDFAVIEALDSDGDTFNNIDEINADTFPGNKDSVPVPTEPTPPAPAPAQ